MSVFKLLIRYSGGALVVAGLGVLGYQIYGWFHVHQWFPVDLRWPLDWLLAKPLVQQNLPALVEWFDSPRYWLVFHRLLMFVLDLVPLSMFFLATGGLLFALVYQGEKERSRTIASVESEMRARVGDKYTSK